MRGFAVSARRRSNLRMPPRSKQNVNFFVHGAIAKRFREAARTHPGRLGTCFSAAMIMFLEADPRTQGEYIKRVIDAEVDDEVEQTLEAVRAEQSKRVRSRDQGHGIR